MDLSIRSFAFSPSIGTEDCHRIREVPRSKSSLQVWDQKDDAVPFVNSELGMVSGLHGARRLSPTGSMFIGWMGTH